MRVNLDKLQWFKFAPTDWIMGKIQRCPDDTQARYMRLVCLYWNKECSLSIEDAEIEIDKNHLDILISKKIVKVISDFIKISFLDEQFESILETSKKNSENVLKRWNKSKNIDTTVLPNHTTVSNNHTVVIPLQNVVIPNHTDKIREDNITSISVIKFEDAVKICLFDENWKADVERVYKIDRNKIQHALTDFTNHCGTIGENTDKSLKNFKKHFTNWVRIKKQYAI